MPVSYTHLDVYKRQGENHELSRSGKPLHRFKRLREITGWMNQDVYKRQEYSQVFLHWGFPPFIFSISAKRSFILDLTITYEAVGEMNGSLTIYYRFLTVA